MNDMTAAPDKSVTVTASAARRVAELIEAEGRPGLKLRVAVNGGGCSGFQYDFDFDEQVNEVAMAMRWLDGAPFTAEQWRANDDMLVQWGFGTAFSEWSVAAVEIARVVAVRDGDKELADKAVAIQKHMRARRRRPEGSYPYLGGMDRLTEWDAVVWDPEP